MKKDKEWAQKEVDRYLCYEGVEAARNALAFAKGVIKQLDEPEILAQKYGYEVEEEPIYYALIKGHENISSDDKYWNYCITDESLDIGDNKVHADVLAEYVLSATKDEWENLGINDDNADFVEVEELEE